MDGSAQRLAKTGLLRAGIDMSQKPADTCYTIYRGMTFSKRFVIKDSNGDPENLTGQTFFFVAKDELPSGSNIISLSIGSGITITALDGEVNILIDETDTDAITQDVLYFTFYRIKSGKYQPLIIGTIEIEDVA